MYEVVGLFLMLFALLSFVGCPLPSFPLKLLSLSLSTITTIKAFQMELWSIWLSGFLLITLSLYATQKLPSITNHQIKNPKFLYKGFNDLGSPKIMVFSAPNPFTGSVGARQALAVRSWLALSPDITVVLFSQDPSVVSFTSSFNTRVSVESNIDFTFLGTPYFHCMVARARASTSDIFVMIDPQTVLMTDFISTLGYAHKLDHDWLLFASSRNISYFPFQMDEAGKHWLGEDGKRMSTQKLQEILAQHWQWNCFEGRMLMAWNNRNLPLHYGVLPPFLYGKGVHNHWVINEAMSSDLRFVFDASLTISSFFLNDEEHWPNRSIGGSRVLDNEKRSWEYLGNAHLGALYGSLIFREANYSSILRLLKCDGSYLFVDTAANIVNPFGYRRIPNLWKRSILRSWNDKKSIPCVHILKSQEKIFDCSLKDQLKPSIQIELPFSLELLLSAIADDNKTIVLAIAGNSYRDMLMSWVCRLKHLQITNFLVCALDHDIYHFSVLQGLPAFRDAFAPQNISFDDCHFGTKCFRRVTKVKSRLVLQILKLGYNVLLSDVDVYWFRNPVPLLSSFGPAVLAAQSDEYNKTGPINLPRRLNSGFYFARSDNSTVAAMEKVVKHASTSDLSEQPSFYDTLCGEGGAYRVGDNKCLEPQTNLTIHFLDRDLFPNGAYLGLWEKKNVKAACVKKGCLILHNNWIPGRRKKLERQMSSFVRLLCCVNTEPKRREDYGGVSLSLDVSFQTKNFAVRIVHAGGKEELYQDAVPASLLMQKYPGMCVARPAIFKNPHESLLGSEEYLLPGQKYLIIPLTTARKLKRKHPEKIRENDTAESKEDTADGETMTHLCGDNLEESVCSANDFYVSREKWSKCLLKQYRRGKKRKHFVPPLPRTRLCRSSGWEPSLTSVQEVSP